MRAVLPTRSLTGDASSCCSRCFREARTSSSEKPPATQSTVVRKAVCGQLLVGRGNMSKMAMWGLGSLSKKREEQTAVSKDLHCLSH